MATAQKQRAEQNEIFHCGIWTTEASARTDTGAVKNNGQYSLPMTLTEAEDKRGPLCLRRPGSKVASRGCPIKSGKHFAQNGTTDFRALEKGQLLSLVLRIFPVGISISAVLYPFCFTGFQSADRHGAEECPVTGVAAVRPGSGFDPNACAGYDFAVKF